MTAGYVQDEWRVSPQLTLNLGLRYEVTRPFVEKEGRVNRFSSGQQSTVRPDAPAGLVYPGDSGVPDALIPTDKNNFAPRVNLVYDLNGDGRTTIRAGWGLFYDGVPGQADLFQNILAPPFNPLTQIDFPDSLSQPNFQDPYGVGGDLGVADNPPIFQGFQSSTLFIGWGAIFHDTPQFNHWNLSVQREIFRDFGLGGGLRRHAGQERAHVHHREPGDRGAGSDVPRPPALLGLQPAPPDLQRGEDLVRRAAGQPEEALLEGLPVSGGLHMVEGRGPRLLDQRRRRHRAPSPHRR